MLKKEFIKNYQQHFLPNSQDFNTALSRLTNQDIKNMRDKLHERKYKFTSPIVGELKPTMKIIFENNYRELEQILMIFLTIKSINDQIEEMKSYRSYIQRLLQKYDNINFNEY